MTAVPGPIVSTKWLAKHLRAPDVRVLDATWSLGQGASPLKNFQTTHIPRAQFFDIEKLSDHSRNLPHMLPDAEHFERGARKLGINAGDAIVAYDVAGMFSAGRAWWMFRAMGHDNVAVLDGGLPKWASDGMPMESGPAAPAGEGNFSAKFRPELIRDISQIEANIASREAQTVDARGPGRFHGRDAEPRPGIRAGHIPGARNVPFVSLLNRDATFKSDEELAAIFSAAGVDVNKPIIASCGSGITANIVLLALAKLGHTNNALYDGSWAEYGRSGLPIEN